MTPHRLTAVLLVVAMACSTAVAATPPLTLDIASRRGSAPFSTHARITVEPNPRNRYLCVQWVQVQNGQQERTSCLAVEGASAPRTHWQDIKDLDAGRWIVTAYLILNSEQGILSTPITLDVFGPGYEPEPPPE